MTRDEIDTMWQQAMQESVKAGEMFTRYHFAKLVEEAEREAFKQIIRETPFSNWFQADWLKHLTRTTPPQRKPLTDEEINDIAKNYALNNPTTPLHFARAIEAAHGIKENT